MALLSGWDHRIKLTIDQTKVDTAAQTNFPVLVYISAASGIGDVDASCVFDELTSDDNRKKIAITTSDGVTECYVEIERWDDANEKAWLWVKVPSVAHNADTDLYLYYDVDHADNDTYVGDTTDAVTHNVWDSNFVGVWHMGQDPDGDGANAIKDSTSNAHDGTPDGTMTTADLVDGTVGKALDFDGSDDYILKTDNAALSITGALTLESTFKTDLASDTTNRGIVAKYTGTDDNRSYALVLDYTTDNNNPKLHVVVSPDGTTGAAKSVSGGTNLGAVSTYYGAGVYTPSTKLEVFLNGTSDGSNAVDIPAAIDDNASELWIGSFWRTTSTEVFNGIIDEVRISNIARSAPWIKATYHSNLDSLITFGSEEILTATNLLDGKVIIKGISVNLLDGKVSISPQINLLDGKVQIKDIATNLLDGKAIVKDVATNLLDGKARIRDSATNLLDGRTWIVYTGQIDDYCPTPICAMSAVFRYARLQASPPVPEASFTVGKIITGSSPVPCFTCTAYHGRNPSFIANSPCPTCSMRVGLSLSDIATISQKAGVPVPSCIMSADTHHLATVYGNTPCPLFTCDGDTVNITVISASAPSPTGLFETTIGNVASILGRTPCPSCSLVALTGQVISLAGSVPVPGSLVRFMASIENVTITLDGTAPTPVMASRVPCFASSVLRHVRGEVR